MHVQYIGDAAVLTLEEGEDGQGAAEAILSRRKNIRTVLAKVSKVQGDRRVPRLALLAGEDTIVTCQESGFVYKFDIKKDFFNGRLGTERRRIAEQAVPDEVVLIPFAGVGPFAIPIAARGCLVIAIEKNNDACRWLRYNARANHVEVAIINADAFHIPSRVTCPADRAVIPTPYGKDDILGIIAERVKLDGTIHFYTFKKKHQIPGLIEEYQKNGLDVLRHRRCGNVAPGVSRWAFDLKKRS